MLQQVMTNPGEITFREVPVPEVKDDQVLVKIRNIGICGSDIHVYHGKHPFTKYPVTQGHEVSGEIAEIGKNVSGFQIGQKVTIEPQVYCGHCYPCRHGKYNLCEELKVMGFQTTGTASEYFAVDASKVTPIPEDMSYEEGAMIEPLAVAVHGVKQMGDVKGMNITVIGAGPIGNLVAHTVIMRLCHFCFRITEKKAGVADIDLVFFKQIAPPLHNFSNRTDGFRNHNKPGLLPHFTNQCIFQLLARFHTSAENFIVSGTAMLCCNFSITNNHAACRIFFEHGHSLFIIFFI